MHQIIYLLQAYLILLPQSQFKYRNLSFLFALVSKISYFYLTNLQRLQTEYCKAGRQHTLVNSMTCLKRRQCHHRHSTYDLETRLPDASIVPIKVKATFPSVLFPPSLSLPFYSYAPFSLVDNFICLHTAIKSFTSFFCYKLM